MSSTRVARRRQPAAVQCRTVQCRFRAAALHTRGHLAGERAAASFAHDRGYDAFREVLAGLRRHCPAGKPIVVRTSRLPRTTLGECIRRPTRFVIRLNSQLDEHEAVETLLHEWAHAVAWNYSLDKLAKAPDVDREEFQRACHDEAWGCAYARVWRTYVVDILGQ